MIKASLIALLRRKYDGYTVYVHNLSHFDANFILKYLAELAPLKLIYKDGKIISIKVFYGSKFVYCITFVDSYQLLPSSLEKLAIAFELPISKTSFPHAKVKEVGLLDLRKEAIKYCLNDCRLLLGVILKFQEAIFNNFKVDITKSPTLSSLSFKIFRKNFFNACSNLIPTFRYSDDLKIRNSFKGGSVGMIKPTNVFNKAAKQLWLLDFNSLYPYIMSKYAMPCGKVRHFVGNILAKEMKPMGFFKVNVTAPDNLKVPVLTTKVLINGRLVNVAPTGAFTDWYFSEELYNARDNFGYQFEILEGYVFSERKVLFSEYMSTLYKLRISFAKDNPMNMIAKLLLNSFYGRWGMTPYFSETKVLTDLEMNNLLQNGNINNLDSFIDFNNGHHLAVFSADQEAISRHNRGHYSNVSICIASAITAYGRIIMSQFKNHPQFDLYYFDTDSIVVDISPDKLEHLFPGIIGNNMGQLKLEHVIDKAVFLAPKTYFLELENGSIVIKVKGLSQQNVDLSLEDFMHLLHKDSSLALKQEVWSKNKSEANIAILEQTYTLAHNTDKRINKYNANGVLTL